VAKVQFVASTLLDALSAPTGTGGDTNEPSLKVQRAQRYLWDFLRILPEIEALYSLEEETS
jgi:hypothetical protein